MTARTTFHSLVIAFTIAITQATTISRLESSSIYLPNRGYRSMPRQTPFNRHKPAAPMNKDKVSITQRLTLNRQIGFSLWLQPRDIPFRLAADEAAGYDMKELWTIFQAMSQISTELNQCVRFRLYDPDRDEGRDHLYIGKTLNDGVPTTTCFSFPGRALRGRGRGQKLVLHNGAFGCMDTVREVAKYLVNVLGLRNEYNRPDRANYIRTHPDNIRPELISLNMLRPYHERNIETLGTALDLESITMLDLNKYTRNGTRLLSTLAGEPIGTTRSNLLSYGDCFGIATMYSTLGCSPSMCNQTTDTTVTTTATSPLSVTSSSTGGTSATNGPSDTSVTTPGDTTMTTSGDTTVTTPSDTTVTTPGDTTVTTPSTPGSEETTEASTVTETTEASTVVPRTTTATPVPVDPPGPTPPPGESGIRITFPNEIPAMEPGDNGHMNSLDSSFPSNDKSLDHIPEALIPTAEPSGSNGTAINWINVVGISHEDLSNWLSLLSSVKPPGQISPLANLLAAVGNFSNQTSTVAA